MPDDHSQQQLMPNQQGTPQQNQRQFIDQMMAMERQRQLQASERKTPAVITRVLDDILVFIEVEDAGAAVGLVFKPDKIVDYTGEPLASIGVQVGAGIGEVSWNASTLKVHSVTIARQAGEPMKMSAT